MTGASSCLLSVASQVRPASAAGSMVNSARCWVLLVLGSCGQPWHLPASLTGASSCLLTVASQVRPASAAGGMVNSARCWVLLVGLLRSALAPARLLDGSFLVLALGPAWSDPLRMLEPPPSPPPPSPAVGFPCASQWCPRWLPPRLRGVSAPCGRLSPGCSPRTCTFDSSTCLCPRQDRLFDHLRPYAARYGVFRVPLRYGRLL